MIVLKLEAGRGSESECESECVNRGDAKAQRGAKLLFAVPCVLAPLRLMHFFIEVCEDGYISQCL